MKRLASFTAQHMALVATMIAVLIPFSMASTTACAQTYQQTAPRPWSSNVIIPQTYRMSTAANYNVHVTGVSADVSIVEQVATTTMQVHLSNPTDQDQVAEIVIPVPEGAVVKGFTFEGNKDEPTTELLSKLEARKTFEAIVAKLKDPALLEFAGLNLIRSSVFPVPAKGTQKVEVIYEHLLTADGDRVDYVLPRSGSVMYDTPWKVKVNIRSKRSITTAYSPSHSIQTRQFNENQIMALVEESATATPGAFQLSYLLKQGAVSASMFAYPDADNKGGYFLLLAGTGKKEFAKTDEVPIKRDIVLVIDRSGSMRGKKIEQAREAARQVVEGLKFGESFNIITYSDEITKFSEQAVVKDKKSIKKAIAFLDAIVARGGTNLHEALKRSLQIEPGEATLPITMFLTDGLPTVGETSELAIRKLASDENPHSRRVFTFGVGYDVNTPLLDKIATTTRAFSTFVLPGQDVEAKVATVFKGLDGPIISNPELQVVTANGKPTSRVSNLLPNSIPDLYSGDQLVVLGRYRGKRPLRFELDGNFRGEQRTFRFEFDIRESAKTSNAFVARLWASRRIASLTDTIRDLGATQLAAVVAANVSKPAQQQTLTSKKNPLMLASAAPAMPSATEQRIREMVDEIVSLSTEFGILTEYTSFLAEEGIDFSDKDAISKRANANYYDRAVGCRVGVGSVNQELNNSLQRGQSKLNVTNAYWTADMKRATITNVQQCNSGAYFRRGERWISNSLVEKENDVKPDRTIEFESKEYYELVWDLVELNRQQEMTLEGEILIKLGDESILITKGKK
ncbi:MAG: VIT domain-containing protein [Planctomycetota bacterium]